MRYLRKCALGLILDSFCPFEICINIEKKLLSQIRIIIGILRNSTQLSEISESELRTEGWIKHVQI